MATFAFDGLEPLEMDMERFANMSDDELADIVDAGAAVFVDAQQEYLHQHHGGGTGALAESIEARPASRGVAIIGPRGKHHGKSTSTKGTHRSRTGSGASHRRKHHGMAHGSSNADVGYYLEYGTPRMPAAHWMETANEAAAEEAHAAMEKEWDIMMSHHNL